MGLRTEVVMASIGDAQAAAASPAPSVRWPGFAYYGFHHVQLATLLSLLGMASPDAKREHYLDLIQPIASGGDEGPLVYAVKPALVTELATIIAREPAAFEDVVMRWAGTEEFAGWEIDDVRSLARELGELARDAQAEKQCILLWQSLGGPRGRVGRKPPMT